MSKMLRLLRQNYPLLKQNFTTNNEMILAQCIKERTLLRVSGNDVVNYLQGLITNDMKHLQDGALSMFTMFLNSKGRVLYDSIVYKTEKENTYLIECDVDAASSLKDHLFRYKVRRKVNIDCLNEEFDVWTIVSSEKFKSIESDSSDYKGVLNLIKKNFRNLLIVCDPRLSSLGLRVVTPKNFNLVDEIEKKVNITAKEENFYKLLRYKLGVGEGLKELPPEKCIPMEANGDYLHGISFHKGCYIGQELTARTYHSGVIRKRLMPLILNETINVSECNIPIFAAQNSDRSIGKLQGIEQTYGLALLRIEEALKADELVVLNVKCKTLKPMWWPSEAPKERLNIGS